VPADSCDARFPKDCFASNVAHGHNYIRVYDGDVAFQEGKHHTDFFCAWIAVLRWAPGHYVGDVQGGVAFTFAVHIDCCEHFIEQLASATHKRFADLILLAPGSFANDHNARTGIAVGKYQIACTFFQGAMLECGDSIAKGLQVVASGCKDARDIFSGFFNMWDYWHYIDGFKVAA
jgi:hypothetical protein